MNLIKTYIDDLLGGFKAYRRRVGGKWYLVRDSQQTSGFGGSMRMWIRASEWMDDLEILKEESY